MICNCEDIETMFLKDHSFTVLVKNTDKVWDAAKKHPVVVTRQKHEGLVLMSKEHYTKIMDKIK